MVNKLAAVEVDLLGKAFVWVNNEVVPETLMTDDTVVDTLVEAEVDLLAVTVVRAEVKTPLPT